MTPRIWPTLSTYDAAFRDAVNTVHDADIKQAKLLIDSSIQRLNTPANKYVSVYPMVSKKEQLWVVRCFFTNGPNLAPPPDIEKRYQEINDYIAAHQDQLPFLVHQEWIPRAVSIKEDIFPFIKSRFISNSLKLGEFLEVYYNEEHVVAALAKQFLAMINVLEPLGIAHGDLDITNILVCGTYPDITLRLVDFDCMYVPTLQGKELFEDGHEHFQPPQKSVRKFDAQLDRFSALVIYLSLIALAQDPELWFSCDANEQDKLLLGVRDFKNLSTSLAYKELRKQDNPVLQKCLSELDHSMKEQRMPKALMTITDEKFVLPPDVAIPIPVVYMHTPAPTPSPVPKAITDVAIPIPVVYMHTPSAAPSLVPKAITDVSIPIPVEYLQLKTPLSNDNQKPAMPSPPYDAPRHYPPPPAYNGAMQPQYKPFIPPAYQDDAPLPKQKTPPPVYHDAQPPQPKPFVPPAYHDTPMGKQNTPLPPVYHDAQPPQPKPFVPPAYQDPPVVKSYTPPPVYNDAQPQQPKPFVPPAYQDTPLPKQHSPLLPTYQDAPQSLPKPFIPPAYQDDAPAQPKPHIPPAYHDEDETLPKYPPTIQDGGEQPTQPDTLFPYDEPTQPDTANQSPSSPIRPLALICLIGIILTFILALITSTWIWLVLTIIFFVLFFVFLNKKL